MFSEITFAISLTKGKNHLRKFMSHHNLNAELFHITSSQVYLIEFWDNHQIVEKYIINTIIIWSYLLIIYFKYIFMNCVPFTHDSRCRRNIYLLCAKKEPLGSAAYR